MKRQSTAGVRRVFLGAIVALFAGPGIVTVSGFQLSPSTVNQPVTIVGRLEMAGTNYFLDPRFVIVDDQNNRTPVTDWAPLELSPPPPGSPRLTSQPHTMQNYLHRRLSVVGIHRVLAAATANGESYIEVQSVIDTATGMTIFNAQNATNRIGDGGTVLGPQGTEPPHPATVVSSIVNAPQPTAPQRSSIPVASPSIRPEPTIPQRPASPATPPYGTPQPTSPQRPAARLLIK